MSDPEDYKQRHRGRKAARLALACITEQIGPQQLASANADLLDQLVAQAKVTPPSMAVWAMTLGMLEVLTAQVSPREGDRSGPSPLRPGTPEPGEGAPVQGHTRYVR